MFHSELLGKSSILSNPGAVSFFDGATPGASQALPSHRIAGQSPTRAARDNQGCKLLVALKN